MPNDPADEAEILALIHRNRIALWTQDWALYDTCIVHADYTTRWNASRSLGNSVRQGWDDIAARFRHVFADPRFNNPANAYAALWRKCTKGCVSDPRGAGGACSRWIGSRPHRR